MKHNKKTYLKFRLTSDEKNELDASVKKSGLKSREEYLRKVISKNIFIECPLTNEDFISLLSVLKKKSDDLNTIAIIANDQNWIQIGWYKSTYIKIKETLIELDKLNEWIGRSGLIKKETSKYSTNKTFEIWIRLTEEEKNSLDKKVEKTFFSRAEFLRKVINGYVVLESPVRNENYKKILRLMPNLLNNLNQIAAVARKRHLSSEEEYYNNYVETKEIYRRLCCLPRYVRRGQPNGVVSN